MRCIIIEDEKPAGRRLQRMLQKENIWVDVLLHSVDESVQWLQTHPAPDLIFADIHLSDGLSFEIFQKIRLSSAIIFTTAYDQYAIDAFKLNSIDYLLKPIKQTDLQFALNKYKNHSGDLSNLRQLLASLQNTNDFAYKQRFTVSFGQHLQSIDVQFVECFYSEDKTTYIYTTTGEQFIYDESLEAIEKQIDPEKFFRVNRKFIINFSGIKDIINYSNSRLKIRMKHYNAQEIIVARDRVKSFKKWLSL